MMVTVLVIFVSFVFNSCYEGKKGTMPGVRTGDPQCPNGTISIPDHSASLPIMSGDK